MSSTIEVKKVTDKKMMKQFIMLPWTAGIYKNDPAWSPMPIGDQKKMFDPTHGYFFEHGVVDYFIAFKDGVPAGRITAHTYSRYEERYDPTMGFFGFYECIDDDAVSRALLDTARAWLKERGKKKMMGPYSFTTYDSIGIDVIGNNIMPVITLYHFAPYYERQFESYGLKKQVDWFCFLVTKDKLNWDFLNKVRTDIMKRHLDEGIRYVVTSQKEIDKRAQVVKEIFNIAWEGNEAHLPFTDRHFDLLYKELKLVIKPELAIFAEKEGKTIGFIFSIPDANPAIAKLNGRLYPWRIVKALWELRKTKTIRTILMGVLPEHRGKDIDAVLILYTIDNAIKLGYEKADCSLIAETNKKMIGALKYLNADAYKGYRVYEMTL